MKKTLAALTVATFLALTGAGTATASTYPAPPAAGFVSDGTVSPGEEFIFSGSGFLSGEQIAITLMSAAGKVMTFTATADAAGNFQLPVTVSDTGRYTLAAIGSISGRIATVSVEVAGSNGSTAQMTGPGADLANTGVDAGLVMWVLVGGGALVAGTASVVLARRRAVPNHARI